MAKKEEDAGAAPQKKGKLKFILIIVIGLLLAVGASVGGTWYFMNKSQQKEEQAPDAAAAPVKAPAIYMALDPAFVVNLTQNGKQRYLQVSMTLMTHDQAALDALKVHLPVIRNNLVMLLSGQDFSTLASPVGIEMLRQKVTASVQDVAQKEVGKLGVDQVLFTNFVLQ